MSDNDSCVELETEQDSLQKMLLMGKNFAESHLLSVQARGHVLASRLLLQILGAVGRENCLYIFGLGVTCNP